MAATYNLNYIDEIDKDAFLQATEKQRLNSFKLNAPNYDDAIILPVKSECSNDNFNILGGVIDNKGEFLMSSSWTRIANGAYKVNKSELQVVEKAIFIGNHTTTWGHIITDSMKKLWFLYTDEVKKLISDGYIIAFVGYNNENPPDYVYEIFQLAGINLHNFIHITQPTLCHHLVLPDSSFFEGGYTKEYVDVINRIKDSVPTIECDKIYFARKKCHNAQLEFGEGNLIKYLGKKGFQIIDPECISIKEQIGLLKGCNCFAATEGSISHNSIFCKPGTKHIIIRKCHYINPYSLIINCAANIDVTYIDSHHSTHLYNKNRPYHGPYYLYVSAKLKSFFGREGFNQIQWFDREWYRYLLVKHEKMHKVIYNVIFKPLKLISHS